MVNASVDPSRLYVGGLGDTVSENDLQSLLNPFGRVSNVYLSKSEIGGVVKRNFAHVTLEPNSKNSVERCLKSINGTKYKSGVLRVELAKLPSPWDPNASSMVSVLPLNWATKERAKQSELAEKRFRRFLKRNVKLAKWFMRQRAKKSSVCLSENQYEPKYRRHFEASHTSFEKECSMDVCKPLEYIWRQVFSDESFDDDADTDAEQDKVAKLPIAVTGLPKNALVSDSQRSEEDLASMDELEPESDASGASGASDASDASKMSIDKTCADPCAAIDDSEEKYVSVNETSHVDTNLRQLLFGKNVHTELSRDLELEQRDLPESGFSILNSLGLSRDEEPAKTVSAKVERTEPYSVTSATFGGRSLLFATEDSYRALFKDLFVSAEQQKSLNDCLHELEVPSDHSLLTYKQLEQDIRRSVPKVKRNALLEELEAANGSADREAGKNSDFAKESSEEKATEKRYRPRRVLYDPNNGGQLATINRAKFEELCEANKKIWHREWKRKSRAQLRNDRKKSAVRKDVALG